MCNCTPCNQWAKLLEDTGADLDTWLQLGPSENTVYFRLLIMACNKGPFEWSLFSNWLAYITPLGLAALIGNYQAIEYLASVRQQV